MATVTSAGLAKLRNYVETNWKYVSIRTDADAELFRLEIGADARATVLSDGTVNPLILQVVLSGDDADVTINDVVGGIKVYDQASGGNSLVEGTITNFTFTDTDDELTIKQTIEIPEIV